MTLTDWDRDIAPVLRAVERNANWSAAYARRVTSAATLLNLRPGFLSRAEAELISAKRDLEEALARITTALAHYQRTPVEGSE